MTYALPHSPRVDRVTAAPALRRHSVPPLFPSRRTVGWGDDGDNDDPEAETERGALTDRGWRDGGDRGAQGKGDHWFFNMKVTKPPDHHYPRELAVPADTTTSTGVLPGSYNSPRGKPRPLEPVRHSNRHATRPRASRDQGRAAKPLFQHRNRKLKALNSPSPAELKEQIEMQTARSIGDSLIFHNIPERCDDTPEAEVVKFCTDYLVGRRIQHVHFAHVHKMEPRFAKEPPIAARFSVVQLPAPLGPPPPGGEEKYDPLPYIPPVPRRRLPVLRGKAKRRMHVCNADLAQG